MLRARLRGCGVLLRLGNHSQIVVYTGIEVYKDLIDDFRLFLRKIDLAFGCFLNTVSLPVAQDLDTEPYAKVTNAKLLEVLRLCCENTTVDTPFATLAVDSEVRVDA